MNDMSQPERSSNSERLELERPDIEYRYIVHIRALETFTNLLRRDGIAIPEGSMHVSFPSTILLRMKAYKDMGLIWSYSVIKVKKDEEVIEEG